jgi:DNA-binding NtrC family response regulator
MERPATSILAVDDEETLLHLLTHILERQGYYVDTASDGRTAITMLQTLPFDLVFLDVMMPDVGGVEVLKFIKSQHLDTEVIMLTAVHDVHTAVECMSLGAYYYVTKPYSASDLVALVDRALERKRLVAQNRALRRQIAYRALPTSMITEDPNLLETLDLAMRAAPTESSVLIQGATGTGKEVVANFVHANSVRKDQPFLVLSCSSMSEARMASELFGHEKGIVKGEENAAQGLLEIADGGTLFLDEIAEMPFKLQPMLFQFIQTGEFHRIGGSKILKSDVRIISATTRDLGHEVESHRFREDLWRKLNIVTLQLPALRDRKNDISLLAAQFLMDQSGVRPPKTLDERALAALVQYDWPGNVRELENVIHRAAVLSDDSVIGIEHLVLPQRTPVSRAPAKKIRRKKAQVSSTKSAAARQKTRIKSVLDSVKWNEPRAAKLLGLSPRALSSKIKMLKLRKPR